MKIFKKESIPHQNIIFLMGPTASGKTKLAMMLHQKLPVDIISVDSALIYRGMNIGTAKPTLKELEICPHRLLDIRDANETYSVAEFYRDAIQEISDILQKNRIPLLVGGTMLYFKSLLQGLSSLPFANSEIRQDLKEMVKKKGLSALYNKLINIDPISANRIHPKDTQRISRALEIFLISGKTWTELTKEPNEKLPYKIHQFALVPISRLLLHQRILSRFEEMLALGFESEARLLFERKDLNEQMPSMRCIGYRQMWSYFKGEINYENMIYKSVCATRQFAKRQLTWLRTWKDVCFLDIDNINNSYTTIVQIVKKSYT
ncbi:tRNA (adenosine(37)-N6)-dimethylallyltransferase MiaA [Candidatus Ishikawella capsulata]|uniref:tRNA dimethylallyltransferase n=1 Tax=Candidatus Ishikawaella capsulata Mpkobe TaxID=476281 RepID=C5WCI2_9ENTR|nr:tRNA (adenosine(37)-N6)-dimethylallyltransferase MiaA [Candidatus Ishikawaella capsulata]BAH83038.1 tRNA delta(2)-isopentenylpyrophosphate transferase [Candidatus Ishikawaella capsulata Mpkobe]